MPLLKLLGPKYGRELAVIRGLLREGEFELRDGRVHVGDWVLEPGEYELRARAREGFAVADGEGFAVALDTEITPELQLEGAVRDLIRRIQVMRQDAGFEVTDRIRITYPAADGEVDPRIRAARRLDRGRDAGGVGRGRRRPRNRQGLSTLSRVIRGLEGRDVPRPGRLTRPPFGSMLRLARSQRARTHQGRFHHRYDPRPSGARPRGRIRRPAVARLGGARNAGPCARHAVGHPQRPRARHRAGERRRLHRRQVHPGDRYQRDGPDPQPPRGNLGRRRPRAALEPGCEQLCPRAERLDRRQDDLHRRRLHESRWGRAHAARRRGGDRARPA